MIHASRRMGLDIAQFISPSNKGLHGGHYKNRSIYIPSQCGDRVEPTSQELSADWIVDIGDQYIRRIRVGNLCICSIPNSHWVTRIDEAERNVFLHTGYKEWIWLIERNTFRIEIDNELKTVWIGNTCSFTDVLKNTCLKRILTQEGFDLLNHKNHAPSSLTIYARCPYSMDVLDDVHREYIRNKKFSKDEIVAIKSVAGSGKTTTLLTIAKSQPEKQILYVAFNKSLILEVKSKLKIQKITNLIPMTFDALMYKLFTHTKGPIQGITDLKPYYIAKHVPFFEKKPFKLKKYYCDQFRKFCGNTEYDDVNEYCEKTLGQKKPLLEQLWKKCLDGSLITFDGIRKQALVFRWCLAYIDSHFDMIMIDETQDFDMVMLKMFLNDTTIPKLFVGDPKQSIYQFRGCINAFTYLPAHTKVIEFYSTFRVGNPACNRISNQLPDCWMISKSNSQTHIVNKFTDPSATYTFLARTWRVIFHEAMITPNVWIYGFDKKKDEIIALHKKLQTISNFEADNDSDDDLPKFLKSLSFGELDRLINSIESNSVDVEDAHVKMYTVHSFKGMEEEYIRIAHDVSMEQSENLYYVAITRGMLEIVIDKPCLNQSQMNKSSSTISKYFVQNTSHKDDVSNLTTDKTISDIAFDMMNEGSTFGEVESLLNGQDTSLFDIFHKKVRS